MIEWEEYPYIEKYLDQWFYGKIKKIFSTKNIERFHQVLIHQVLQQRISYFHRIKMSVIGNLKQFIPIKINMDQG